jgi:hypothetical protein
MIAIVSGASKRLEVIEPTIRANGLDSPTGHCNIFPGIERQRPHGTPTLSSGLLTSPSHVCRRGSSSPVRLHLKFGPSVN